MKNGDFWQLGDVSDAELQARLSQLLANGYRTEARIVAHLAEVEERRLHLRCGSSSMFDYCVHRLDLSNGEAFQRLTVARLARQFPVIFGLIERREVHMSGLCLLRDYLTPENHLELLAGASHKTKFQILEMLARRFPRPDVASTIRKLPSTQSARVDVRPATASDQFAIPTATARPPSVAPKEIASVTQKPRQALEPLSEARYRLQLNVTASMREKLELARALLSHSVPSGDFAELLERALDELLAKTQKQRFAQTKSPRRATSAKPAGKRKSRVVVRRTATVREHIPNAIRREVVARDGFRCTFVGEDGCRCTASSFLQIHHEQPWAKGGESSVGNLRLLCASHNRLLAEQDFGRDMTASRRDEGRSAARVE
jgi:5-methylcytosine-specific restriction endonuclease McrA